MWQLCLPAYAGHYTVTYSGGTWSDPYNSGPYSSGGYYGYGASPSYTSIPALVSCSGTITATCTWVPDYGWDAPPASCIVEESCTASSDWTIQQFSGGYVDPDGTAAADSGLPGASTTIVSNSTSGSAYDTGYRVTVVSSPGTSFSVSCTPSASAYASTGTADASIVYNVAPTAVTVDLEGTTNFNSSMNILIGQGILASLNTGSFHQLTWAWDISGDPFDGFQLGANNSTGHAIEMTAAQKALATVSYYYRSTGNKGAAPPAGQSSKPQTVTCVATVTNPADPNAPLTVTGKATVNVWQPGHSFTHSEESLGIYQHPAGVWWFEANGASGRTITWTGTVATPSPFIGEGGPGTWNYTQLIKPNDYYEKNNVEHDDPNYGKVGLDSQFSYLGTSFPADGSNGVSGDRPTIQINNSWSQISLNFNAWTWMLYMPPSAFGAQGTTWVPLHEIIWNVAGTADFNGVQWTVTKTGSGVSATDLGPVSVLPDWMRILTASDASTW